MTLYKQELKSLIERGILVIPFSNFVIERIYILFPNTSTIVISTIYVSLENNIE
jgi:hypothetical protein